ncbi:hypothetical protein Sango_2683000 [Sesamum angolense]|uniref:Uncharacterized protein n=1 Tax=Sesamum angolense TaxID=2727404 RepID=A0AAE1W2H0_9LAMI|nr:hypothetical protein Sango_2683000 [Sesamum angolense]
MPNPSFLEFIMLSRMFVDSLHSIPKNSSMTFDCLLAFSALEVSLYGLNNARKMVCINSHSGLLEEQHPIEQCKGFMWAKYFNMTLLKAMDDLADGADDKDPPYEMWQ